MSLVISVEGNIGAGKSTFLRNLKKLHKNQYSIHDPTIFVFIGVQLFVHLFFMNFLYNSIYHLFGEKMCFYAFIIYVLIAITIHFNFLKYLEKEKSQIVFVEEPVKLWKTMIDKKDGKNILEKYGENQKEYAFTFQIAALITQYELLIKTIQENPNKLIICERSIFSNKDIFTKMLYENEKIDSIQYETYCMLFDLFVKNIPNHRFIYLSSQPENAFLRKEKRNRSGEEKIDTSYLKKLHMYHEIMFKKVFSENNVMEINIDNHKGLSYNMMIQNTLSNLEKTYFELICGVPARSMGLPIMAIPLLE